MNNAVQRIHRTVTQRLVAGVAANQGGLTIQHTTAINAAALVFGATQHRQLAPLLKAGTLPLLHTGLTQTSFPVRVGQATDYLCHVAKIPNLDSAAKFAVARQIVAVHDAEIVQTLGLDAALDQIVDRENQMTALVSTEPWRLFGVQRELARRMSDARGFGHGVVSSDNSLDCDLRFADSLYPHGREFHLPRNSLLRVSKDHACDTLTVAAIPADSKIDLLQQVCEAHLYGRAPNTNISFLDGDAAARHFLSTLPRWERWQRAEILAV